MIQTRFNVADANDGESIALSNKGIQGNIYDIYNSISLENEEYRICQKEVCLSVAFAEFHRSCFGYAVQ